MGQIGLPQPAGPPAAGTAALPLLLLDCSTNPGYPPATKGDRWCVSVAGTVGIVPPQAVQVGDEIEAKVNSPGGFHITVGSDYNITQGNLVEMTTLIGGYGTNAFQAQAIAWADPTLSNSILDGVNISPRGARFVLDVRDDVETVTATTETVLFSNANYLADASSNAITFNLPAAASATVRTGQRYRILKIDSTPNQITINPNGSERIAGRTEVLMDLQGQASVFYSDGTEWHIVGEVPRVLVSPAQFSSAQDDFNPPGFQDDDDGHVQARALRLDSSGNNNFTGLKAPNPAVSVQVFLINVASGTITIQNEDINSLAANRFLSSGNVQMQGDEVVLAGYDPIVSRWRIVGKNV